MSVASVYAKALFESAPAGTSFDLIEKDLADFSSELANSKDLSAALLGPVVTPQEKISVIEAVSTKSGLSKFTIQFLSLLARKGRVGALDEIRVALRSIRVESEGGLVGRLVSADAVSDQDVQELASAFSKKLGKRVVFQVSKDSTLLAGVKVIIQGVTYDGSLQSQLQRLRDQVVSLVH